jgi:hypothetical protein
VSLRRVAFGQRALSARWACPRGDPTQVHAPNAGGFRTGVDALEMGFRRDVAGVDDSVWQGSGGWFLPLEKVSTGGRVVNGSRL